MPPPESGQPRLGQYLLVREIARSNDIVWEGRDPRMNRHVAVKELALPHNLAGQARRDRIERFYREARAAGAMNHPNIVTIHEVGEDRGRYFIAMEYLEGGTLRERLSIGGPLPLSEALSITNELCGALQYAHERSVVHRDIKPDNIHILPGGQVKLTDFGIARITTEEQLTVAGQIFGTPSYMAPEQVLGRPVDARADQFSLAIVVYEMISGSKPFTGDSVPTITYRIVNEEAPHAPGAPPAIDAVLHRALAKDPAGRYPSIADFCAALTLAAATRTGMYAAPLARTVPRGAAAPDPTAYYGTQTQFGIAPGFTAPPLSPACPVPAAPLPARYGEGRQRNAVLVLLTVLAILLTLGGGGLLLSRAFSNYKAQASVANIAERFSAATRLYEMQDFLGAANGFAQVRATAGVADAMKHQALQYEVFCDRELGHEAQSQNDLDTAARWYQTALALNPNDASARAELAGVEATRNARGGTPAAPTSVPGAPGGPPPGFPPLDAVAATPAPANVTTNDFLRGIQENNNRAQPSLDAGKRAAADGKFAEAQNDFRQAMGAGPGSNNAREASALLDELQRAHPDGG